ncbi:TPA: hypothetical protein L6A17_06815 [Pseudomonas aeruginosa]|nr:hypothetical protein [Pseudomonas aeruginosa]HBP6146810.1 hypothetical protein [Pseudomonas aeruginosa]HBP6152889.1 hypothetical protein [Pseudomonas aeruginosa]HBP6368261.1 hypothetical protein [Pseudomonas aeruginosa]HBP6635261.1 hypothetical protein [Pseudomonas aeruginosa]
MIRPFRRSQNALIGGLSKPSDGWIGSSWNTGLSSQFFSFQLLMALLIRSMSGLRWPFRVEAKSYHGRAGLHIRSAGFRRALNSRLTAYSTDLKGRTRA